MSANRTGAPPSTPVAGPAPILKGRSLRGFGVLVLVMFLLTSAVGGSLALESSYLIVTLVSHIGLALVTLGIAGYTASVVGRRYPPMPRAFCGLAALSALVGTLAGTVFLVGGMNPVALDVMEAFAVLGIVASIGMIVVGAPASMQGTAPARS